jgi:hypothetical protein
VDVDLEYAYDAAPGPVFSMLTNAEFLRARSQATNAVAFEIVECRAVDDGGFRIVTTRTVEAEIPGFARKFFKPTNAMTQTEDWKPASSADARDGTWRIEPHGVPVSVSTFGTTRLEGVHDRTVHRIDAVIKVSVPLVGGKLERFIFDQAKGILDAEHEFGREWMAANA